MLMLFVLTLLITSALLEAFPYYKQPLWRSRRIFALAAILFNVAASVCLLWSTPIIGVLFSIISVYRIVNLTRLYVGRLIEQHLRTIGLRSFLVLYSAQLAVLILTEVMYIADIVITKELAILLATIGSFIGSTVIFVATLSNIIGSRPKKAAYLSDSELPTLTVAIAARNETPTLVSCLESVVASNYPKLEILVLDDDSQDTTAEIIKSFAQDGVRFVGWEKVNGEWLSKNRAYQTLLQHASGEYILYMGVDVRLHEQSLRRVVEQIISRDVAMMTLVPKRTKSGLLAIFIQPMRYWWELAVPHALRHRPPALSTSWIIHRNNLDSIGGFNSFKRSIIPEEHLARHFYAIGSYAFVRTTKDMLITTHKSFFSQWDTQVRTRYPHAHRRPEAALLQSILLTAFVIWPFIALPLHIFSTFDITLLVLVAMSALLYIASHVLISIITNPVAGFFAPLNFPIAIALDICALHTSMYKYEFSKVIWKGRDVAQHKLKVIKKLPEVTTD